MTIYKFFLLMAAILWFTAIIWYTVLLFDRLDVIMTPRESWNYYIIPTGLFLGAVLFNIASAFVKNK